MDLLAAQLADRLVCLAAERNLGQRAVFVERPSDAHPKTRQILELVEHYLRMVQKRFDPVPVGHYAASLGATKTRRPDFPND